MSDNKYTMQEPGGKVSEGNLRPTPGLRIEDLLPDEASRNAAIARFWAKTNRATATENECWVWFGATWWTGYARFTIGSKDISAHRFAFLAAGGIIPDGLQVTHRCVGRRKCVNPAHLRAESASQNQRDRQFHEKYNPSKRLSEPESEQIRRGLAGKVWPRVSGEIAERYGVSVDVVARIAIREDRRRNTSPLGGGYSQSGVAKNEVGKNGVSGSGVAR